MSVRLGVPRAAAALGVVALLSWFAVDCSGGGGTASPDGGGGDGGGGSDVTADPCAPDPCSGVAGTHCVAGKCVSGAVILDSSAGAGATAGRYTPGSEGQAAVLFSARRLDDGSVAVAFRQDGATVELVATMQSAERCTLTWAGVTLDGAGALTEEEAAALEDLAGSPLAESLALIPLELGCLGDAVEPDLLAGLLVPWQALLKYRAIDRAAEVEALAARASCGYFVEWQDLGGGSERPPAPDGLLLGHDSPVPAVFSYFPFDADGAAAPASAKAGAFVGPCGYCRGACGPDCPARNTAVDTELRCEIGPDQQRTGNKVEYTIITCGSHTGCIEHDDCYDDCGTGRRCDSIRAAVCRRKCDAAAVLEYGPAKCASWMRGGGPFEEDKKFVYEIPTGTPYPDDECVDAIRYSGSYVQTGCANVGCEDVDCMTPEALAYRRHIEFLPGGTEARVYIEGDDDRPIWDVRGDEICSREFDLCNQIHACGADAQVLVYYIVPSLGEKLERQ